MHRVPRAAARTAVAALLAVPLLVLGAGTALAAPGITLDPTGELAARAAVTVTATGFTPGTTVVVAECRPDDAGAVTSPQQCADAVTGSSAVAVADAQGSLTARITVTVGDIRSGVSCTAAACVIAAISTATTAQQALAPVTLTGEGTSLPVASASPAPSTSPSAAPSSSPTAASSPSSSPTDSSSPSATPVPSSATPTVEAATSEPAPVGNSGTKPGKLAKTGPDEAWRSLVVGLVALQLGLVVAMRTRRARPAGAPLGAGRHRR